MCGIYGQVVPGGVANPALIARMARCLAHRGPDGDGMYHDGPLAFGAGRLAIIDLSAPAGPIFSEDRRVSVVFNGEIYNHRALRAELEACGHHFATHTDTEVIVHGYEQWGLDVLAQLRGMFGLGLWDAAEQRLLLARDRIGEKPLYYTQYAGEFLFASEIKALFERPGLPREVEREALLHYLALGHVPAPLTMFAGIHKLAPGEFLLLDREGRVTRDRYWQMTLDTTQPAPPYAEAVGQVRAALLEAVELEMMSDVPVGAFLSGGVDSTAVVGIMRHLTGHAVRTFTVGYDFTGDPRNDAKFNADARHAAAAAAAFGTQHHAITVRGDESLAAVFPHLVWAMDEPVAMPAVISTAFVTALARVNGVPVLLNGEMGDELFLGYPHFKADRLLGRYLALPALLRKATTPLLARTPTRLGGRGAALRSLAEKARRTDPLQRFLTWVRMFELDRLPALLADPVLAQSAEKVLGSVIRPLLEAGRTPYFADRVAYASIPLAVSENGNMRVDKMSMVNSVESRAPFQDYPLVEQALHLPLEYKLREGDFKRVLKDAVRDFVPEAVLTRPKWGFFAPSSEWLRTALLPLLREYLSAERVAAAGFFDPAFVTRLVDDHLNKRSYELWPLWTLLVFQLWHALYIEGGLTLDEKMTPERLVAVALRSDG